MISAFTNIFKIPELRQRIVFTLIMLILVRAGAAITIPGVNAHVLNAWFDSEVAKSAAGGVAALANIFAGGALEHCAIFSLGIMPYISASIMMQLLTAVIPRLNKLAREETGGRQKIMQYTRYLTLGLCLFQGYLLALSMENPTSNPFLQGISSITARLGPLVTSPGIGFQVIAVITLTAGTMFLMWIGDQITDRGIGNGTSMIITVGIVATLPGALVQVWNTFVPAGGAPSQVSPIVLVLMFAFLVLVIAAVVALTQGQRRISIQYAKRVVGRKVYGGQTQYLPLKVNAVGVMPIIFAQAILLFPSTILSMAFRNSEWAVTLSNALAVGPVHYLVTAILIFFFSYFWVAIQFQPTQIADDLKKYNGYIPGYRPGKPTADFLEHTLTRLTFAGATFLTLIAVLPEMLITICGVPRLTARFFGGTSLLIIVGVILDTMRQVETFLIQRHYDGFLRKGRLRGRFERTTTGAGSAVKEGALVWMCVAAAVLALAGVAISLFVNQR
ncbi:MAG: preprotein translocase subunit SecY [Verrucomicrobia bacterium]|nr:preprotein translocase subunit SecY [Verrucomicrobiota bacterium]